MRIVRIFDLVVVKALITIDNAIEVSDDKSFFDVFLIACERDDWCEGKAQQECSSFFNI